jgi:hypothetical protein
LTESTILRTSKVTGCLTSYRSFASGASTCRTDFDIPRSSAAAVSHPAIRIRSSALRDNPPLAWTLELPAFVATRCVEDLKSGVAAEVDDKIARGVNCRRRNPVALNEGAEPFRRVDRLLQPEAVAVVSPAQRDLSMSDDSPRGAYSQHDTM